MTTDKAECMPSVYVRKTVRTKQFNGKKSDFMLINYNFSDEKKKFKKYFQRNWNNNNKTVREEEEVKEKKTMKVYYHHPTGNV